MSAELDIHSAIIPGLVPGIQGPFMPKLVALDCRNKSGNDTEVRVSGAAIARV